MISKVLKHIDSNDFKFQIVEKTKIYIKKNLK